MASAVREGWDKLMGPPECSRYEPTLGQVRELTAADRAAADLHRYLDSFTCAKFDQLADRLNPDEFTDRDFRAVRKLNVSVLRSAQQSLLGDAKPEVTRLLRAISDDLDIWDVAPADYDSRLSPDSPAWQPWQLVFDKQKGARSAGRGVTAGKLLHAKRPRLVPIFDRARISKALSIDHRHMWEALWCVLRDPDVRSRLCAIQASVDQAAGLSLLRVLDIVAWMSQEP
jgi:Family of unknown function (DUF6308)